MKVTLVGVNFNPRPREEGDPHLGYLYTLFHNFNPRPREEGDQYFIHPLSFRFISIHALVKRAT